MGTVQSLTTLATPARLTGLVFVASKIDFIFFNLIKNDPDDNKFVDSAIAGNATFVVSNDSHFDILKEIDFPKLMLKSLQEFSAILG